MKKIAIIVAMDKELLPVLQLLTNYQELKLYNRIFFKGTYNDYQIIVAKSLIGKVNAAITTSIIALEFAPDVIINTGIAAAFNMNLKTLDTIIANKVMYADVDMTPSACGGLPYGQIEDLPRYFTPMKYSNSMKDIPNVFFGNIASGDQFVTDYDETACKVKKLAETVDAFDMESASIAHTAFLFDIPFIIVRTISDIIGSKDPFEYETFSKKASEKAGSIIEKLLNRNFI